jgi:thiosulfate/3-mercaptopyruvate sulfurtransferase
MSIFKKSIAAFAATVLAASIGTASAQAAPLTDSSAVVTTQWLADNLNNPKLKLIEVTIEEGDYARKHIRNAFEFDWHTDLVDTVNRDVISQANFTKLAQKAGVDKDSIIVLYGDNSNWFAAWGAWIFKLYGAKDVRLLDGGKAKWLEEGKPITTVVPGDTKGNFVAAKADKNLRAFMPEVLKIAKSKKPVTKLVDIRSADEFNGKIIAAAGFDELAVRAGHIPNAVNIGWKSSLNPDGTFKSKPELIALYKANGIDGKSKIITYCRIGERAAHTWFVLTQILGYKAANYDGSWTEYGNAVGVPIINKSGFVWGKK